MIRRFHTPISRRGFLAGFSAAGVSVTLPEAFAAEDKVAFYNWRNYIGENTIVDFEQTTGIQVQYDLFANDDELFAKLKDGNPGYDLIVPSNDFVERMLDVDMLLPLDHSKIPNIANLDPLFLDAAFDPGRRYSLPYLWGSIGIGYRKSAVNGVPDSWATLFSSDEYSGRIALMSDATTVMQMALKLMGKSLNDWTDENIAAAEKLILAQKPNVVAFANNSYENLLLSGDIDLAMAWNGDIRRAMDEDDDIGYIVPKEGSLRWEDTLAIPTSAPDVDNAHRLINYLLDAQVGADIAEFVYYATPNKAAKKLMSDDYLNNPAIFPPKATAEASEVSLFPGWDTVQKIDDAWTRIQAG